MTQSEITSDIESNYSEAQEQAELEQCCYRVMIWPGMVFIVFVMGLYAYSIIQTFII